MMSLKSRLAHPLTRGLSIDDPQTTLLRRRIIQEKSFLCLLYSEWYENIVQAIPAGDGFILELGSGAGFLSHYLPELITSEVFSGDNIRIILDAHKLPFLNSSLRAVVMVDVFHHLAAVRHFFTEAARCVRPGGKIIMIEPWLTPWSQRVYQHLHHEPFVPEALNWEFTSSGPLSGANGALPWIVFSRDRLQFTREFPEWQIADIQLMMPFAYLISGGVSCRSFAPGLLFGFVRKIERLLASCLPKLAMFAQITLQRTSF